MSTPFVLKIPRRFYEEIINQAVAELPNECCGLLAGTIHQSAPASRTGVSPVALTGETPVLHVALTGETPVLHVGHVERRYPLVNAAEVTGLILSYLSAQPYLRCTESSPVEYFSDDKDMFTAVRDMRLHGIDLLAIYHSHPSSAPTPSRKDLQRNYYGPEVMHLIISLQDPQQPQMRGWWLQADEYVEADWVCDD